MDEIRTWILARPEAVVVAVAVVMPLLQALAAGLVLKKIMRDL